MTLKRQVVLQVTTPAVLVALAMLATSLLGIRSINRLQADQDKIVSEHADRLQTAQDLETYMRHIRFHSLMWVMDPSPERWAKVDRDQTNFETTLARLRDTAVGTEERAVIADIGAGYERYRAELEHSGRSPPGPDRAAYLRWSDAHPIRHLVVPCDRLLEITREAMRETALESARTGDRTRTGMILLGVVGAAGGLVGGFGVAWGLSRSITRLHVRLRDVHAHLDREVGSVRVTADGGDLRGVETQVGAILDRVRAVVDQLQRQEREALRAEHLAAVGQLAAGLAHEIRNPLTSIKLLVGAALEERCVGGLTRADLEVIHDEVGRLERKVEALLDYARPPQTEPRPTDVAEVVHRAADLVKPRLAQQAVRLALDLPAEPVVADLDPDQFHGVLANLMRNALDAMPGGGTLGVRLTGGDRGRFRLDVTDTGPGLDPAVADRLFAPFVSTKPTGTGLGLCLSRRVVRRHGGDLTAANAPGGGACLTVAVPAAPGGPSDADPVGGG